MSEITVWGVHAGSSGEADRLFRDNNVIAIGWEDIGDLSKIKPDREAFKQKFSDVFPDEKAGAVPVKAGQLYRFVNELQVDDIVVYPSKIEKQIYIGKIESDYIYDPNKNANYPNIRKVKWLKKNVPRTYFSQGALYEIGAAITLFQIKNFSDEFLKAIEIKQTNEILKQEETTGIDADEIEQLTRDFILKTLARELKGHPFAYFVAHLLNIMGYQTRVSPEGPDGGIDIIAHKDELGFEPPIIKVQVKSKDGNIGDPDVSQLYGKVGNQEFGLLVTLGGYTVQAKNFAREKSNLRIIDGNDLVNLVINHYEKLDSKYKGMFPLKKVYIPEDKGETDN